MQVGLDFSDLPQDGAVFETLISELLASLGFSVETTGKGPDLGVDLIASKSHSDDIGGAFEKRYVVQCKHYASSKRPVGQGDMGAISISECINANHANGYLLACSTEVTSSLKQHMAQLVRAGYLAVIWEPRELDRLLSSFPEIVAKFFPYAKSDGRLLHRPDGKRRSSIYDDVIAHQKIFVGSKFIPKLYVSRGPEKQIYESLKDPRKQLEEIQDKLREVVSGLYGVIEEKLIIPQVISVDEADHLTWISKNREESRDKHRLLNHLRKPSLDVKKLYEKGGGSRVLDAVTRKAEELAEVAAGARRIVDALGAPLRLVNTKVSAYHSAYKNYKKGKRKSRPRRGWRNLNFLRKVGMEKAEISKEGLILKQQDDQVYSLPRLLGHHQRVRDFCEKDFARELEPLLGTIDRSTIAVVDPAGAGKTNMCCRIALQLSNQAFPIFITGKSQKTEFRSLHGYIVERVRARFLSHGDLPLRDHIARLYRSGYQLVIILDGVNEAEDTAHIAAELGRLLKIARNSPMKILVTSRIEYWPFFERCLPLESLDQVLQGKLANFQWTNIAWLFHST